MPGTNLEQAIRKGIQMFQILEALENILYDSNE
jgi:hypothetical protein